MKKQINDWKLVILWEDNEREILGSSLPECVKDEINTHLNELEDLRLEHDSGLRGEPYSFAHDREDSVDAMEWSAYTAPQFKPVEEFYYVSRDGIALDDSGNEVRDENGQIIIVPKDERHFYDLAYRHDETPEEHE